MPEARCNPTDEEQIACVRDYFFQKIGTQGVSSHIDIDTFEKGMRKLRMNVRDTS